MIRYLRSLDGDKLTGSSRHDPLVDQKVGGAGQRGMGDTPGRPGDIGESPLPAPDRGQDQPGLCLVRELSRKRELRSL